jgi:hypothetical protein
MLPAGMRGGSLSELTVDLGNLAGITQVTENSSNRYG